MLKRILITLAPTLLGLGISVLLVGLGLPVLVIHISIGMAIFVLGVLVSVLMALVQLGQKYGQDSTFVQGEQRRLSFIRRLDHELKNPLTGLRAALANLSESAAAPDREKAAASPRRDR